jgi:hypothetical protein
MPFGSYSDECKKIGDMYAEIKELARDAEEDRQLKRNAEICHSGAIQYAESAFPANGEQDEASLEKFCAIKQALADMLNELKAKYPSRAPIVQRAVASQQPALLPFFRSQAPASGSSQARLAW